jgi:predicted RNase H-like HicB family nuclease
MTEPTTERRSAVKGYEVVIGTTLNGTIHVTCPELPQLCVQDDTLSGALYLAEDAIDSILAGEFAGSEGHG